MPGPRSLLDTFVSRLEKLGIPCVVTGAVAAIIYGEPRLTNHVELSSGQIDYKEVEEFIHRYGLEKEWAKAKSIAGLM